ncbi:hypothetical protein [Boseongicola sp. H5]|uniref:hypothetical protein n=1 Tax=Boseongicola sp. H5 TaxID=2763261 RepID=UPI001D0B65F9|nr:hypothetical protein [Boseongicola sp. H5]
MLKFLFGGRKKPDVKIETQRESFVRLVTELNEAIDALPDKPRVTIDPASGHILPEAPEHFPDEALALPAPGEKAAADAAPTPEETTSADTPPEGEGPRTAGTADAKDAPGQAPDDKSVQSALEADGGVRTGRVPPVLPGTPVPNPPKAANSAQEAPKPSH